MNRAGAALALALLVLLVLEGVVLGTVYLAVQERRVAHNGVTALRLRFAAEAAARAAAATWPAALDSLVPGALSRARPATAADGLLLRSVYQRIDSALVLVFAEASEPPPRAGRARAALLIQPPLLSDAAVPAAALVAGAGVKLGVAAVLSAASEPPCATGPTDVPVALRLPAHHLLRYESGATVDGAIAIEAFPTEWTALLHRLAAALGEPDAAVRSAGVLAIAGDYTVRANTSFRGVILVGGSLTIEPGATVEGVVLVAGPVELGGTIRFSACAARDAIRAAGLHRPRAFPLRPWLPSF